MLTIKCFRTVVFSVVAVFAAEASAQSAYSNNDFVFDISTAKLTGSGGYSNNYPQHISPNFITVRLSNLAGATNDISASLRSTSHRGGTWNVSKTINKSFFRSTVQAQIYWDAFDLTTGKWVTRTDGVLRPVEVRYPNPTPNY